MLISKLIIRMDDITPWMDMEKFEKYVQLFDEFHIKPLLGIVPACEDEAIMEGYNENFWHRMEELTHDGWLVAMHGYNHVYTSKSKGLVCKRRKSEFAGYSVDAQREMLRKGKDILNAHNFDTDVFMPPGHSYDKKTLIAMKMEGFRYLTDGRSLKPYRYHGIACIPARGAYRLQKMGLLTICVHSGMESETDYKRLREYIARHQDRVISFEEACSLPCMPYPIARIEELCSLLTEQAIGWMHEKFVRKKVSLDEDSVSDK